MSVYRYLGWKLRIHPESVPPESDLGKIMNNLDCFGVSSYISYVDRFPNINVFIPNSVTNPPLTDIIETMREIATSYKSTVPLSTSYDRLVFNGKDGIKECLDTFIKEFSHDGLDPKFVETVEGAIFSYQAGALTDRQAYARLTDIISDHLELLTAIQ